jgi:SAM-dependent methyltransferase
LLRPLLDGRADAVFGSRYMAGTQTRVLPFWHSVINKTLTLVSNMFCNLNLTDMETCYKVFRTDLLKSIPIRSDRFGFEPEIVMKSAKRKLRIYEVPVSYHGRTYEEGKKIGWKDGIKALGVILKYWVIDDLYATPYGRGVLNNLTGTPQYLSWLAHTLRPHLGDAVLEVSAGIGNMTSRLMTRRLLYMAAEKDPLYLHALRNRFLRTPNVVVQQVDPEIPKDLAGLENCFDTVLCVNVLEYVDDPKSVLERLCTTLKPTGKVVILVPQNSQLYGSADRRLGHKQRFSKAEIREMLHSQGLAVEKISDFNKAGTPPWWAYSKRRGARRISKPVLKIFDKTVWAWRRLDSFMPWTGLSLIVVARKGAAAGDRLITMRAEA